MPDIKINESNGADTGTELFAQESFGQDYVFQANATHAGAPGGTIDGLHGMAEGLGIGVLGKGGESNSEVSVDIDRAGLGSRVGVVGVGGNSAGDPGIGVVGIGGNAMGSTGETGEVGVFGSGGRPRGTGVLGDGDAGIGVNGRSRIGRGGVFTSGSPGALSPIPDTSTKGGIAQVRLIPSEDNTFPTDGRVGDLWVHASPDPNKNIAATLWLCIREDNDGTKRWSQVVTAGFFAGGDPIPPGT
jgi:hypothetical protein